MKKLSTFLVVLAGVLVVAGFAIWEFKQEADRIHRKQLINEARQCQVEVLKKLVQPVQEALKAEYAKGKEGSVSLYEYSQLIASISDNDYSSGLFIVLSRAITFVRMGINDRDSSYGRLIEIQDALSAYGQIQDALRALENNEKANLETERDRLIGLRGILEWHLKRLG